MPTVVMVLVGLLVGLVASPAEAGPRCMSLPPPAGPVIHVGPGQASELPGIVASAQAGATVVLTPGVYNLDGGRLVFWTPNVTLRSSTGNRADVVLDGNVRDGAYVSLEIISIFASDITIADVTIQRAYHHPVHITPPVGSSISGVRLHNVHVLDPGAQAIKINATDASNHVDNGVIRCSLIELTDAGRPFVRDDFLPCYTGGIDAHRAHGWEVSDNVIRGFWCPAGLSEHGIHFWNASRDTLVERNILANNARGIGFGLGGAGHTGGVIRNNFVVANDSRLFASAAGFDVGIGLESAAGARVFHNTVASTGPSFASVDWRFPATTATIVNNLVTHTMRSRDGGSAVLAGNLASAPLSLFVDVEGGDLHLRADAAAAIDRGAALSPGDADDDIDGDSRSAGPRDIGADELGGGAMVVVVAAHPTSGRAPLAVAFDGGDSSDPGGTIVAYSWDFGDGATEEGMAPSHTYTAPGRFTATLRVTNDRGENASESVEIVVTEPPTGPTITLEPVDRTVRMGRSAAFRVAARASGRLRYQWQRDGVDIPGAIRARYVTPPMTAVDDGATFRCVVSNGAGSVPSRAATLTVKSRP